MTKPRVWTDSLAKFSPCEDGLAWAKGFKTLQEAWDACERPDWMLWFLARRNIDRKVLVLCACDCAATALPIWRKKYPDDKRPAEAIRVARAWAHGKASIEEVRAAAAAAAYAAAYAASYAADYAAYAAADAASAAADAASYAASTAASAADYAAYARTKANRKMAQLIRERVPQP